MASSPDDQDSESIGQIVAEIEKIHDLTTQLKRQSSRFEKNPKLAEKAGNELKLLLKESIKTLTEAVKDSKKENH